MRTGSILMQVLIVLGIIALLIFILNRVNY